MTSSSRQPLSNPRRLELIEGGGSPSAKRSPLVLWHLLSLDAPTIAALWTSFVAWCAGVRLSHADVPAMFLVVWMLYATDRLLDARPLAWGIPAAGLEERHRFHHRHRSRFLPSLALAAIPLALLLYRLPTPVLALYAVLASLLAGWLLLVHAQPAPSAGTRRLPKEFAVGLFFPAAVFIPTVARAPALRPALLPGASLFAFACILNCLFLYAWEHPGNHSRAHATTRWSLRLIVPAACLLTATSALVALHPDALPWPGVGAMAPPHRAALPAACALSGGLLLLLHGLRRRMPALRLRALTDTTLLTPLIPMLLATTRIWR